MPPGAASIDLRATRAIFLLAAFAGVPAFPQSRPTPRFAPPNLSPPGVRALAANCAQCHGTDGHPARGSTLAPLAGRPRAELAAKLSAFKAGKTRATVMDQLAKGYSDEEIAALADYFASRGR